MCATKLFFMVAICLAIPPFILIFMILSWTSEDFADYWWGC